MSDLERVLRELARLTKRLRGTPTGEPPPAAEIDPARNKPGGATGEPPPGRRPERRAS